MNSKILRNIRLYSRNKPLTLVDMKNLILFLVILLGLFGEAGCSEMELPVEVPTHDVRLSLTVPDGKDSVL